MYAITKQLLFIVISTLVKTVSPREGSTLRPRAERDSNPRAGCEPAHKLSRLGRYNRFGIAPNIKMYKK